MVQVRYLISLETGDYAMFRTYLFKDSKRPEGQKRTAITRKRLFQFDFDESVLPYFELVPAKLLSDSRYVGLTRQDQGDFLRFIMLLWLDRCRCVRSSLAIALNMGMEVSEWEGLEGRLLKAKLLEVSPDGAYLVQLELRELYLMNRQSNDNKKRYKKTAIENANETSIASTK